jgi:hypothetical protein
LLNKKLFNNQDVAKNVTDHRFVSLPVRLQSDALEYDSKYCLQNL